MQSVLNSTMQTLKPPPKLTISEWADSYRKLSPESSAESGSWHTSRCEYQREIMDSFNQVNIERIVVMTSSQVGKTEILLNAIGYYIDQDSSPVMVVQPNLTMGQAFSKDRLAAMIRDSDTLREKVSDAKSRDSGNTTMHKKFPGGHITISSSGSAAGLSSRPIRILLLDEIDRFEHNVKGEGSPISLATARTKTFFNRKIFMCSTPTIKGISAIESAYEESDQRYYNVPCPECNTKQVLKWKNVIWDEDKPETACYACEHCGSLIDESSKQWMISNGEWIATKESNKTAGFHISELYSVWSTWSEMAFNFLEAKKNPETLKTFVNTALGESWTEEGDTVEHEDLLDRRLNYDHRSIPEKVLVIVAGCDTQKDRIEITLTGFGRDYCAYVIDHLIFWGDPNAPTVWSEVDEFLKSRFQTDSGRVMPISCTCIDSGGLSTNQVYQFTKPRQARRIFAIKGSSVAGKPIASKPTYVGKNKAVLYSIGTDTAKETIFARLTADPEKSMLYFPSSVDENYFEQLTAEKRVARFVRGRKTLIWKQIRPRNETLDCLVYCFAAVYILNPNWDSLELNAMPGEPVTTPKEDKNPLIRQRTRQTGNFSSNWKDL